LTDIEDIERRYRREADREDIERGMEQKRRI
jgi:hypothetical protein